MGEGLSFIPDPPACSTSSTSPQNTIIVVRTAAIVPGGIERCGSARSPERFEPASGSVTAGKKMASTAPKLSLSPSYSP